MVIGFISQTPGQTQYLACCFSDFWINDGHKQSSDLKYYPPPTEWGIMQHFPKHQKTCWISSQWSALYFRKAMDGWRCPPCLQNHAPVVWLPWAVHHAQEGWFPLNQAGQPPATSRPVFSKAWTSKAAGFPRSFCTARIRVVLGHMAEAPPVPCCSYRQTMPVQNWFSTSLPQRRIWS